MKQKKKEEEEQTRRIITKHSKMVTSVVVVVRSQYHYFVDVLDRAMMAAFRRVTQLIQFVLFVDDVESLGLVCDDSRPTAADCNLLLARRPFCSPADRFRALQSYGHATWNRECVEEKSGTRVP